LLPYSTENVSGLQLSAITHPGLLLLLLLL
jgi:hypothetical protein